MNYAISDIHGYYEKYAELLEKIRFSDNDTLYILGDVIDRGKEGIRIIGDIMKRQNVKMLMGNHEKMAIDALPVIAEEEYAVFYKELFSQEYQPSGDMFPKNKRFDPLRSKFDEIMRRSAPDIWLSNGGMPTSDSFFSLSLSDAEKVWEFLKSRPLYMEVNVEGKDFVLVHSGFDHFYPNRPLQSYDDDELLWCRPETDTVYFEDKYTVFGHTPTRALTNSFDSKEPSAIFRNDKIFDIDCGCGSRDRLGCLCLDDLSEIYV